MTESAPIDDRRGERRTTGSVTRGFLFADLRDYTSFVDRHGAAAAADLLLRFRALVRSEIDRFEGAEIRTEGDSFYVVFGSVSAAVECGLALAAGSRSAMDRSADGLRIGVGIHAGETIETADGYVGSPVNIAARLCSLARPGEVLVSATVRSLTQTVLPVRFVPRGRRHLKGVAEPVTVFGAEAIEPTGGQWTSRPARIGRRRAFVAGFVVVTAIAVAGWYVTRPAALPGPEWTIGLVGWLDERAVGVSGTQVRLAVQLAVDDANAAGGIGGATIVLDTRNDMDDPGVGAAIARLFSEDPDVVAMIGSLTSPIVREQIPITNAAGLLQCSPSATAAVLTKPAEGALALRPSAPDRPNFVRFGASDDIEAAAAASFAYRDLGARTALVVDDTGERGRTLADGFEREFAGLGGDVVRRALNPGADPAGVLEPLAGAAETRWIVFFGGFAFTGAPEFRLAMVDGGHADVPFLTWEGVYVGRSESGRSFVEETGDAAVGSFATAPSIGTVSADFERGFRDAFGDLPEGGLDQYAGAAYACAEIVLEALRRVAESRPSAERLRESVRAYVVDPARRFDTVLGSVGFDANGDSIQQFVTFYRVDPADGAAGEWVIVKQQDFGHRP